ncbi:MAG: regulatory protein GemA [Gammaproteobacteria bacterium]|nr:MAG: regulatory protein GemA [Gammaproteobacteria bacterium]
MDDRRRSDLARIHLAKKQLGLDDEAYRDMLWTIARVRSAADLDDFGRRKVIEHLRKCGATFRRPGRRRPKAGKDKAPLLGKVYALLGDRPASYAEGILQRMYGKSAPARLEWASTEQLRKVVAALNYDKRRHPDGQTSL